MCDALWQTLLKTAILAPSPHNIQPWGVLIRDRSTADLYFDRLPLLPDGHRTGSFMITTAGMFIEALLIVAAHLTKTHSHLPILFTCGRSDLTVSFYGANIYPAKISEIIQRQPDLKQQIHSFQLSCTETDRVDARLKITLELLPDLIPDRDLN